MFDICHPTYYNMSQLGCNDQVKLTTAFYVYMELCEVKRYWDVKYKFCEPLQLFYLEAKKSKNLKSTIFIPWPSYHNLSLDLISNIQRELEIDKFTFVFKEGDTTSVYYSISSGIVKPLAPEEGKVIRKKMKQHYQLDNEINKNAANLYERALLLESGELDIPDRIDDKDKVKKQENGTKFHSLVKIENIEEKEIELLSDDKNEDSSDINNYGSVGTSDAPNWKAKQPESLKTHDWGEEPDNSETLGWGEEPEDSNTRGWQEQPENSFESEKSIDEHNLKYTGNSGDIEL